MASTSCGRGRAGTPTACQPIAELPDGRVLRWEAAWSAYAPATGTTGPIDLPAVLTPTEIMPAWSGGFVAIGIYKGKPWLGHVGLVPGQPLVCP